MKIHLRHHVPAAAYMTPAEVLQRLRVNARTLYRLMNEGQFPAVRIGRQWRIRPTDFELWLQRQTSDAGAITTPDLARGTRSRQDRITDAACRSQLTGALIEGDVR